MVWEIDGMYEPLIGNIEMIKIDAYYIKLIFIKWFEE